MPQDPKDRVIIEGTYLDDMVYLLITFIAETGGFFLSIVTLLFAAFVFSNPSIVGERLNVISNLLFFSFGGGVGQMHQRIPPKKKELLSEEGLTPPDYYLPPDS